MERQPPRRGGGFVALVPDCRREPADTRGGRSGQRSALFLSRGRLRRFDPVGRRALEARGLRSIRGQSSPVSGAALERRARLGGSSASRGSAACAREAGAPQASWAERRSLFLFRPSPSDSAQPCVIAQTVRGRWQIHAPGTHTGCSTQCECQLVKPCWSRRPTFATIHRLG